jgi:Na+:H+ antiporter, NhaA family
MERRTHVRIPVAGRALSPVGSDFVSVEVLGGAFLLFATAVALVWANFAAASYADVWEHAVTIGPGSLAVTESVREWVNSGPMAVFFFVVGIEIKRELVRGELRDPRTASLPAIAALGGMVVPALLYLALNPTGPDQRGWAIPMATDIAFAVVVLAVLGSRVSRPLKLFLLTLAIVDDIGAVIVIALFYSHGIALGWLAAGAGVIVVIVGLQRLEIGRPIFYVLPAVALWVCLLESGVHAAMAGVALGLLTPARTIGGRTVIEQLEARLHLWSSLLVVPLFAVANAGVELNASAIQRAVESRIAWGVALGLIVGKPLGIMLASALAVRTGIGRLPDGVSFRRLLGVGMVAGIGFTVSLFVAGLSFTGERLDDTKFAILAASVVSATVGALWIRFTNARD